MISQLLHEYKAKPSTSVNNYDISDLWPSDFWPAAIKPLLAKNSAFFSLIFMLGSIPGCQYTNLNFISHNSVLYFKSNWILKIYLWKFHVISRLE